MSALLLFLMIGLVAAFFRWNATHQYFVVRVGENRVAVRLPVAPSFAYTPLEKGDVNATLETQRQFDIKAGLLTDELHQLSINHDLPIFNLVEDLKGVRASAVKGHLSYRAALQMMLSGTRCNYEVVNDDMVLVWCKTHAHLVRAASTEDHESDSDQRLLPSSDADLPHTPSTEIHPKDLRVDAYVDNRTLSIHIPAGDAQFTIPAWEAITRVLVRMKDLPTKLVYDTKVIAGHPTRAVHGPFTDEGVLDTMLKGSGLQWRQADDAVIISLASAPPTAH
jgi:hypothetical protein